MLDFLYVCGRYLSLKHDNLCTAHAGRFGANFGNVLHSLTQECKALFCGIRTLVVLSRQIFPDDLCGSIRKIEFFKGHTVALRLGENAGGGCLGNIITHVFHIVPVQITNRSNTVNSQKSADISINAAGLVVKAGLSFNIDTNHG